MKNDFRRDILALSDDQLEIFIHEWVKAVGKKYHSCASFSGAGDCGRDVVGFHSAARFDGAWDNYQCKQYATRIPTATGIREVAKILYNAYIGRFSTPSAYFFVAPRGLNRNLEELVFSPSKFKDRVLVDWDNLCATEIIENQSIPLDDTLREFIGAFDFSRISRIQLEEILAAPEALGVLSRFFGADPGPAPRGVVPTAVQPEELRYVSQLIEAYSERDGATYLSCADIPTTSSHVPHLAIQRERFFDTDAFKRFYRDSTDPRALDDVEHDVWHGVHDRCMMDYDCTLARINAVLSHAAVVPVSGLLMPHARTSVKQGYCHHFANEGRLEWKQ